MISVIVPIYNSHKYLHICLESILNQSCHDFELLLVDDGSTDQSLLIIKEYQKKDPRVKVYHKENGGQGSARNMALQFAVGDYIMFVDSDDALSPDTLAENYKILKENPTIDCLQYPVHRNYASEEALIATGKEAVYSRDADFKKLLLDTSVISLIVCDKIFRKDLLAGLYFQKDMIYEDNYFMVDLIERINKMYISEKGMYYYYRRANSTTTSAISLKSELSTLKVLKHTLDIIHLPEENELFLKYLIRLINVDKSLRVNFKHSSADVKNYKKKLRLRYFVNINLGFKNTIKLIVYKYFR